MQFIPERLVSARAKSRLTQQKLADSIGAALRSVQAWEKGETEPRRAAVEALSEVLRVPVARFYASPDVLREESPEWPAQDSLTEKCHKYLGDFLESCEGDPERLIWTRIELERHFPLDHWGQLEKQKNQYYNRKGGTDGTDDVP